MKVYFRNRIVLFKWTNPVWVRLWIFKFSERANTFPHGKYRQTNGFSPVWTRMWLTSLYFALKPCPCLEQSSHKQTWFDCSLLPTCSIVKWLTTKKTNHHHYYFLTHCELFYRDLAFEKMFDCIIDWFLDRSIYKHEFLVCYLSMEMSDIMEENNLHADDKHTVRLDRKCILVLDIDDVHEDLSVNWIRNLMMDLNNVYCQMMDCRDQTLLY